MWTADASAGVKCNGYFSMTFFHGRVTKTHVDEMEDSTRHFDEWGVVSGAKIKNVTDGSQGIVRSVTDDTLFLDAGLSGGTSNLFSAGDSYRVLTPSKSTSPAVMDLIVGPFLMDTEVDFVSLGIRVGDTIYNQTRDDWGVITTVDSTFLIASGVMFSDGDSYVVRYNFVETREYRFAFDYAGQVHEKHGLRGTKRRDVCSNDGPTPTESDGVGCQLSGTATSGSNGQSMIDSSIGSFLLEGVNVGDLLVNLDDGEGSGGIIDSITGNSLTVSSLNGGAANQFSPGNKYLIYLRENMNDGDGPESPDTTNDDFAKVEIRDRDDSGSLVGFASAHVPSTGTAIASVHVQDLYADIEIQVDAGDTSYDLPLWFTENKWHRLIYVAASEKVLPEVFALDPPGVADLCIEGTDCLRVDGLSPDNNKEILVIAAGPPLATQDRLTGTVCGAVEPSFLCDYFEGENADFDFDESGPPPPTFEHTPIGDAFNDQVKIVEVLEP